MSHDLVDSTAGAPAAHYVPSSVDVMTDVIRLTQSLFPGPVRVEVDEDPELPGESHLILNVAAEGDVADIINRRLQWRDRVFQLAPERAQRLKLSVDAKA